MLEEEDFNRLCICVRCTTHDAQRCQLNKTNMKYMDRAQAKNTKWISINQRLKRKELRCHHSHDCSSTCHAHLTWLMNRKRTERYRERGRTEREEESKRRGSYGFAFVFASAFIYNVPLLLLRKCSLIFMYLCKPNGFHWRNVLIQSNARIHEPMPLRLWWYRF